MPGALPAILWLHCGAPTPEPSPPAGQTVSVGEIGLAEVTYVYGQEYNWDEVDPYYCPYYFRALGDVTGDGRDDVSWWTLEGRGVGAFEVPLEGESTLAHQNAVLANGVSDWDAYYLLGTTAIEFSGDTVGDALVLARPEGPKAEYAAFAYAGPLSGELLPKDALWGIEGPPTASADHTPLYCSSGEDVDGDGLEDLLCDIFTAQLEGATSAGASLLFLGPFGEPLTADDAATTWVAAFDDPEPWLVWSRFAGDLDGDGVQEVSFAELWGSNDEISVSSGNARGWRETSALTRRVVVTGGQSVTMGGLTGDVTGDGREDLALTDMLHTTAHVGWGAGAVWLYSGGPEGTNTLGDADWSMMGGPGAEYLGAAVANVGDQNGDGWLDVLIGAQGTCNYYKCGDIVPGEAYVVFGPLAPGQHKSQDADVHITDLGYSVLDFPVGNFDGVGPIDFGFRSAERDLVYFVAGGW